jgi:hypothetical protein
MDSLASAEIIDFLNRLSQRNPYSAIVYLLGGGAMCLMGSPRRTLDIDYNIKASPEETQKLTETIQTLADEMKLELEYVPIEEFIPLPRDAISRHRRIGQFGNLTVYVFDPYSIALSKLARGFEADLQDIQFLLKKEIISLDELEILVDEALPQAWDFDIDPAELRRHFSELFRLSKD